MADSDGENEETARVLKHYANSKYLQVIISISD